MVYLNVRCIVEFKWRHLLLGLIFLLPISSLKAQKDTVITEDTLLVTSPDSVSITDSLPFFDSLGPFCSPVRGKVISHFGPRHKRFHAGTDIKLQLGDSVRAAFSGIVTRAKKYYGYGLLVVLKHQSDIETYYGHLSKILVKVGDTIQVGKAVGLGGRTGRATTTHLHFEFRVKGIAYDSEKLFDFEKQLVLNDSIPAFSMPVQNTLGSADNAIGGSIPDRDRTLGASIINSTDVQNEELIHTVKKKDTLYSLARRYGTTVDRLCALNNLKPNGILRIGQRIKVR